MQILARFVRVIYNICKLGADVMSSYVREVFSRKTTVILCDIIFNQRASHIQSRSKTLVSMYCTSYFMRAATFITQKNINLTFLHADEGMLQKNQSLKNVNLTVYEFFYNPFKISCFNFTGKCQTFRQGVRTQGTLAYYLIFSCRWPLQGF